MTVATAGPGVGPPGSGGKEVVGRMLGSRMRRTRCGLEGEGKGGRGEYERVQLAGGGGCGHC